MHNICSFWSLFFLSAKKNAVFESFFFCYLGFGFNLFFLQIRCEGYFVCTSRFLSGVHNWYRQCFKRYPVKPKKIKKKWFLKPFDWSEVADIWKTWYSGASNPAKCENLVSQMAAFSESSHEWKSLSSHQNIKNMFVGSFSHRSELNWTVIKESGVQWKTGVQKISELSTHDIVSPFDYTGCEKTCQNKSYDAHNKELPLNKKKKIPHCVTFSKPKLCSIMSIISHLQCILLLKIRNNENIFWHFQCILLLKNRNDENIFWHFQCILLLEIRNNDNDLNCILLWFSCFFSLILFMSGGRWVDSAWPSTSVDVTGGVPRRSLTD